MDHSGHDETNNYQAAIFDEQIGAVYRQIYAMLVINLLAGAALVYGFLPIAPASTLFSWYGVMVAVALARLFFYISYEKSHNSQNARFFAHLFTFGCVLSGISWSTASVIFFLPDELYHQLLILFVLAGMGAGSVASLCAYKPAFYAYFLTSMSPIVIRLWLEDGRIHTVLAFLLLFFIVSLSFFALQINRSFINSLRLRFENSDLVAKLREQKDEAEKANDAKSKFLAAASHDLRQPLHALTLYTSILGENLQDVRNKKLIIQINKSIDTLQSLFNALLDISRLEAGTLIPERRDFRLQPMLDRLINDFSGDTKAKGLELSVQAGDLIVHSDMSLVEQILRNYISNAIRYTNSGSIVIACEQQDRQLEISVTDTGMGIPNDQFEAIYGEFYQLKNPERDRSKGLGLGLAIVKRISQLLDHRIGMESDLGAGSRFSITVPLGSPSTYVDLPKQSLSWINESQKHGATIVIIDDDVDVRESTEALFLSWGCNVITGSTPQEVLETLQCKQIQPDAVIADYRLSGGRTGIGAIDLLKSQYGEQLPALIITGDTASEPLQAIQNSGIPLINKPVAPAKLRSFLNNLQNREQRVQGGKFAVARKPIISKDR